MCDGSFVCVEPSPAPSLPPDAGPPLREYPGYPAVRVDGDAFDRLVAPPVG